MNSDRGFKDQNTAQKAVVRIKTLDLELWVIDLHQEPVVSIRAGRYHWSASRLFPPFPPIVSAYQGEVVFDALVLGNLIQQSRILEPSPQAIVEADRLLRRVADILLEYRLDAFSSIIVASAGLAKRPTYVRLFSINTEAKRSEFLDKLLRETTRDDYVIPEYGAGATIDAVADSLSNSPEDERLKFESIGIAHTRELLEPDSRPVRHDGGWRSQIIEILNPRRWQK